MALKPTGRADELDVIPPSEEERNEAKANKAVGKMLKKKIYIYIYINISA